MGGLSRRNQVLEAWRAAGPVVVFDAGVSLVTPKTGDAESPAQRRLKAALIAEAMAMGGIDAMALGKSDWTLGVPFVTELVDKHHLPVLAANLSCEGKQPYPASKVVEVAGRRLGVIGVTLGEVEGCEVSPAAAALTEAREGLPPVDIVIALIPTDSDRGAAEIWSEPVAADVVLDARGRAVTAGADRRGDAAWISAGSRGKSLGTLVFHFDAPGKPFVEDGEAARLTDQIGVSEARIASLAQRIAKGEASGSASPDTALLVTQKNAYDAQLAELKKRAAIATAGEINRFETGIVELDDTIKDHSATEALVVVAKEAIAGLARQGAPPTDFVPRLVADATSPFAGGETCVACHAAEHGQWSTTGHARAWRALVDENRAFDESCWACHVTGQGVAGGPPTAAASGPWRDVQCEACHGPARGHVAAPTKTNVVRDPPVQTCVRCHDGQQDGGRFDFAAYRPQITHAAKTP